MRKLLVSAVLILSACAPQRTEILWDTWGVPHIFAGSAVDLFHAYGYAQAESHANLMLRLYGQARGGGAEYWGDKYLEADQWTHTMGVPALAAEWLQAQPPDMRQFLDAFARGVNDYAREHPGAVDAEVKPVLPVEPVDLMAHTLRIIHFSFVANPGRFGRDVREWTPPGSNTWAIAPPRSASGHAMLLANPHLPWSDFFTWHEAQLAAPGVDVYGATLVGLPVLAIAFNDSLGWSHTVNTYDGADLYELTLEGDGYRWDGAAKPFETQTHVLKVRKSGGAIEEREFVVKRSIHGPVIGEKKGKALALRVAGLEQPGMLEQYWLMAQARNLREFEAALSRLQIPMFTVMYADRDGRIMHLFGGRTPIRSQGDWAFWQRPAPGDLSATLWSRTHPYADLPRVVDPPSGWLQNANDPPWTTTFPQPLDPSRFPPYMAPQFMDFRAQRSARMLDEDSSISFEEMVAYKHSTRMELADRILDPLLTAAKGSGSAAARRGAAILARWDRCADAESAGAVLFEAFVNQWQQRSQGQGLFGEKWRPDQPRVTPRGLRSPNVAVAALAAAVTSVEKEFGSAGVAWGKANRLRSGDVDLPANGGPGHLGIFRVVGFSGRVASSGDSYVAAIQFSQPVRAQALIGYGNSSQPGSKHAADQLPLFAKKQLRPVWRTRAEVEAHLESRKTF
ncbi:MAG: acylase [Bryobacteraceae bacterium]|nr:acylase [Bryobacteraceae bacterium]